MPHVQHDAPYAEGACVEIERVEGKPQQLGPTHAGREQSGDDRVRFAIVSRRVEQALHLLSREGPDVLATWRRRTRVPGRVFNYHLPPASLLERVADHAMTFSTVRAVSGRVPLVPSVSGERAIPPRRSKVE